jgi:hypothetical protein
VKRTAQERLHQIRHTLAFRHLRGDDLFALDLHLDDLPEDVGIGVLELLGVPLIAERVHELARELQPRLDEGPSARPSPRLEELVTAPSESFRYAG